MSRQLMIPPADTRLYAVDAPGGTPALLFLSGGFGTVQNWSRVIRRLDGRYRTVRFDARARHRTRRGRKAEVRTQFRRLGWIMRILAASAARPRCLPPSPRTS